MLWPLRILAVGALLVGYVNAEPLHLTWLGSFLEQTPSLRPFVMEEPTPAGNANVLVLGTSIAMALAGVALAWFFYVAQPGLAGRVAAMFPRLS